MENKAIISYLAIIAVYNLLSIKSQLQHMVIDLRSCFRASNSNWAATVEKRLDADLDSKREERVKC